MDGCLRESDDDGGSGDERGEGDGSHGESLSGVGCGDRCGYAEVRGTHEQGFGHEWSPRGPRDGGDCDGDADVGRSHEGSFHHRDHLSGRATRATMAAIPRYVDPSRAVLVIMVTEMWGRHIKAPD